MTLLIERLRHPDLFRVNPDSNIRSETAKSLPESKIVPLRGLMLTTGGPKRKIFLCESVLVRMSPCNGESLEALGNEGPR